DAPLPRSAGDGQSAADLGIPGRSGLRGHLNGSLGVRLRLHRQSLTTCGRHAECDQEREGGPKQDSEGVKAELVDTSRLSCAEICTVRMGLVRQNQFYPKGAISHARCRGSGAGAIAVAISGVMKFVLSPAVWPIATAVMLAIACDRDSPSNGGPPVVLRGGERLGWDQPASSGTNPSFYTYIMYVDGWANTLTDVNCEGSASSRLTCSSLLPWMSPGRHS